MQPLLTCRFSIGSDDAEAATTVFVGDTHDADFVGPSRAGLHALLIDPDRHHDIDDHHRLATCSSCPNGWRP